MRIRESGTYATLTVALLVALAAPAAAGAVGAGAGSASTATTAAVGAAPVVAGTSGIAAADNASADDATAGNTTDDVTAGPVDGLPAGVESFENTSALDARQTNPASLAGTIRVESAYADDASIDLRRNSSSEYTLSIAITGNATNVSFYLQREAVASSQNLSDVVAEVDGEPTAFGTADANDTGWVAFEIDQFSTRTVTFSSNGSTASATGDPATFANTSAPNASNVAPESLADDVRVSDAVAANASVTLDANATGAFGLTLDASNATNVTTYVAERALAGTNVTNVSAAVDGESATTTAVDAENATWYGVVVPSASNATVNLSYDADAPEAPDDGTDDDGTDDDATSGNATYDLPAGVVGPNETAAVGGAERVAPVEFSGKTRVGADYANETTIDLVRDEDTNATVVVRVPDDVVGADATADANATANATADGNTTVDGNATSGDATASFYVRYDLTAGSAAPENVTVRVDNESIEFGLVETAFDDETENTTWIAVALTNATSTVTVESPEGTLAPPERAGPPGADAGRPGPAEDLPASFADFATGTTPANPASGATIEGLAPGMVRIESGYAADATITLERNDASNTTLDVEVTGDATNVTFYFNARAIASSQNVEGLVATVDTSNGTERIPFAEARAAQGAWIAVEVDHFSERQVTFRTQSNVSEPLPGAGTSERPRNLDADPFHEDVNGDGRNDVRDTIGLLFANESKLNDLPPRELSAVDANGDGEFGFADVLASLFD